MARERALSRSVSPPRPPWAREGPGPDPQGGRQAQTPAAQRERPARRGPPRCPRPAPDAAPAHTPPRPAQLANRPKGRHARKRKRKNRKASHRAAPARRPGPPDAVRVTRQSRRSRFTPLPPDGGRATITVLHVYRILLEYLGIPITFSEKFFVFLHVLLVVSLDTRTAVPGGINTCILG